jgi:hypothetical protein
MKTSELIAMLMSQDLTETEAYNLIVDDMFEFCTEEQVEQGQRLIQYFMYKIQNVCFPVIKELRKRQT